MGSKQIKLGALLSYVQMGLSILVGLIYTTIMIDVLGQNEHGLYQSVVSIISALSMLNLGFNSGYIRYYSKYKKDNDYASIYRLNGLFLVIFTILGVVSFVCGLYLANHLEIVFSTGLVKEEYILARKLLIIQTINLSISFPMSVFSNIIMANEKFVFLKLVGMVNTVLGPFLMILLLMLGYRSVTLVVISLFVSSVVSVINVIYVFLVIKSKFWFKGLSFGLFSDLLKYTVFIALNMLIDQINWNVDKILLGRFQGTIAVSIYSVAFSLHQYYQNFSIAVSDVFTPRIHDICNSDDSKVKLTALFIKVGRLQFALLFLIITGFVFFGRRFIRYWVGDGFDTSYYVALLLMIPDTFALIQNIGIEIQRALNKHQFRSIVYFAVACINFLVSIFLCQIYGPVGVAIGTAVSIFIGPIIVMNIFYHKKCSIDIPLFWKNIVQIAVGGLPAILISFIYINKLEHFGIAGMLLEIIIYSISYCVFMWFISLNAYEKSLFLSLLKNRRQNK